MIAVEITNGFRLSGRDEIGLPVRNIISGKQELTNGSQAS